MLSDDLIKRLLILFIFLAFTLSSCNLPFLGITATPLPASLTPTPTCPPNIVLATPVNYITPPILVIVLFDPNTSGGNTLEYKEEITASNIIEFIQVTVPRFVKPGDLFSSFRMGVRSYESARAGRWEGPQITERLQTQPTPVPHDTLTPVPTLSQTRTPGLDWIPLGTAYVKTATAQFATEIALTAQDDCARQYWDQAFGATATAIEATFQANTELLSTEVEEQLSDFQQNAQLTETPFESDAVYEGLSHATADFEYYCNQENPPAENFSRCILIVFDDLIPWGFGNPNGLHINLSGVDVLSVMPNCKDINQTSCNTIQQRWADELKEFGARDIAFTNGERLEAYLSNYLQR